METETYARFLGNHLTAVEEVFEIHGKTRGYFFDTKGYSCLIINHLIAIVVCLKSIFETKAYAIGKHVGIFQTVA